MSGVSLIGAHTLWVGVEGSQADANLVKVVVRQQPEAEGAPVDGCDGC